MKLATITLAASAASLTYTQLPGPACALGCFISELSDDSCSSLLDFECHCKKGQSLIGGIEPCVIDSCPKAEDLQGVLSTVNAVCKQYDVVLSITLPASFFSLAAGASTVAPVTGLDAMSVLASATDTVSASAASSLHSTSSSASSATKTSASASSNSDPFGFLSSIASEITSGASRTLSINTTPVNTGTAANTLVAEPSTTASAGFAPPRDVSGGLLGAMVALAAAIL
ncbi:uncharacterized protein BDZ99DRAFT_206722 [Mytilinidion resinicola]|uniref:CFEM domain-containing protein n=1 Tax=Mytilinidion resinicola TaxID=574789 RepID=A0A6A6Y1W5_9PEZI|nr:uncharacterized protein BDZ99DRAFT_206722 [Mytilinidion resinicola]KAF2802215.1 hypothetical protein BDZ99DRAFT_206722 [Mytilinidion resinicola]